MAITWGSFNGNLRFGIDATVSTPSASSTTVTVSVKLYIQVSDDWRFDDTQSWRLTGTGGGSGSFSNTLANGAQKLLHSESFAVSISYTSTSTRSWSASLSGAYNGADPTHSRTVTIPLRPASAPSAPSAPTVGSITATSAAFTWSAGSTNGSALTGNAGQVSRNSSFTDIVSSWSVSGWAGRTVTGLPKGTTLYVRVRAQNGEGWSSWSASRSFSTLSTAASAPTITSIYNIEAQSAWWAWSAPSDNGGETITGYEIQYDDESDFTASATFKDPATPAMISRLMPGTTYYTRIRAVTSFGAGAWSSTVTFRTLSALYVGTGTDWVPALVWIGNGTSWAPASVKVGTGTEWK